MRTAVAALLLVAVLCLAGCQTMARDEEQSTQKYSRIAELNRRMLAEDIETFWLLDQPSTLTDWKIRGQ